MTEPDLPAEVARFVRVHINSVEQLEVLLLLREFADRKWTPVQVGVELRTSPLSAAARLKDLVSRGFVAVSTDGVDGFEYRPANEVLGNVIREVANAYAARKYTVIQLIFSKPAEGIRSLADAFLLVPKKEDEHG